MSYYRVPVTIPFWWFSGLRKGRQRLKEAISQRITRVRVWRSALASRSSSPKFIFRHWCDLRAQFIPTQSICQSGMRKKFRLAEHSLHSCGSSEWKEHEMDEYDWRGNMCVCLPTCYCTGKGSWSDNAVGLTSNLAASSYVWCVVLGKFAEMTEQPSTMVKHIKT